MPTILITGASDGIGRQTAKDLAATGADLIVHGRSASKLAELVAELEHVPGHGRVSSIRADLGDLDQVRAIASELAERVDALDVLLHNAGVFMTEYQTSAQGHEATWAINVLAPTLATHLLLGLLRASPEGGRVINVSSVAHNRGASNWDAVDSAEGFSGYAAYARSKLALTRLTSEMARRVGERPLLVSLHPGVVTTKLLTEGFNMQGPDSLRAGAATSVMLASAPITELRPHQGGYFARSRPATPSAKARDAEACAKLYELVRATIGVEPIA